MTANKRCLGTLHKVSGPQNRDVPRDCVARNAALTSFAACSGALRRNKPLHQLACRPQAPPATVKPVGERRIRDKMI